MALQDSDFNYPKIPFSYQVTGFDPLNGQMHVKYIPNDANLTHTTCLLPFNATFTPETLEDTIEHFAPYGMWHGQAQILLHSSILNQSGNVDATANV
jgi:hypothetical protein